MQYIFNIILVFNFLFVVLMIFRERKKPEIIVSWLLLVCFLPIVGFVFYVLFGSGLSFKNKKMLRRKIFYDDKYQNFYRQVVEEETVIKSKRVSNLIKYNLINSKAVPTFNNNIKFFVDGKAKIESLIDDIKKAKHSINMEYYIFSDDFVGEEVMQALCDKAKEGVKVKLIYDSVGCLGAPRRFFRKLKKAGGEVKEFFPPLFYIRLVNLKMNYRNHRKIAVIDGKIGYVGGINIRKDHLGYKKKVSPWRDAHIRVKGQAVYALQNTFFNFWQFCNNKNIETQKYINEGYFPKFKKQGDVISQIITSGPNNDTDNIKETMIKMISIAEKQIILQTPYFVPDEMFLNALKQAVLSGVKVKIMLPQKPDKKIVYLASLSFVKSLIEVGAEVYLFKGFLHSKALIVDGYAMCLGTANADYRSFSLNFEIDMVLYNSKKVEEYLKLCEIDFAESQKINLAFYKKKHVFSKIGQTLIRLFAPIL